MAFQPRVELYGLRTTVYGDGNLIDIGYLDEIIDQNTFVVDGATFFIDQSDDFTVDNGEIIIYNAIMIN
jgi:hypothetical protein